MCFHKNYKIYYLKRRSLRIVERWRFSSDCSLDDCTDSVPIFLTKKVPSSIVQALAVKYQSCIVFDTIEGYLDKISILKVYSKTLAKELVKNYKSRVIIRK